MEVPGALSTLFGDRVEDPMAHGGRRRRVAHVEGNYATLAPWACIVFLFSIGGSLQPMGFRRFCLFWSIAVRFPSCQGVFGEPFNIEANGRTSREWLSLSHLDPLKGVGKRY